MQSEAVQRVAPKIESVFQKRGKTRPMEEDEAKFFMMISLSEMKAPDSPIVKPVAASQLLETIKGILSVEKLPFPCEVMVRRLQAICPDMIFCPGIVLLCSGMAKNPAEAVMLAYSLWWETNKLGQYISVAEFGMAIVPVGFPTDERFSDIWSSQKGKTGEKGGNWLDLTETWK